MMKEKQLETESMLPERGQNERIRPIKAKRTGIHRLSEYTDGMLELLDIFMSNKQKFGKMAEEVDANTRVEVDNDLDPSLIARKDEALIKTERFKVLKEVQEAVAKNVKACANSMSFVALKTQELQFSMEKLTQQQAVKSKLATTLAEQIKISRDSSNRMYKMLQNHNPNFSEDSSDN